MRYQFEKGIPRANSNELLVGGLTMTDKTIRTHLMELEAKGFVIIYASKASTGYENEARVYEIDCKKLGLFDPVSPEKGGGNFYPSPPVVITPHHGDGYRLSKDNQPVASPGLSLVGSNDQEVDMLKTPKKERWTPPTQVEDGGAQVVQRMQQAAVRKTAAVVASVAAKPAVQVKQDELQTMLNALAQTYAGPGVRVTPTNVQFGVWKKNLAKFGEPADLRDFLVYTLSNWKTIFRQQRTANERRLATGQKAFDPISAAPNFADLAYRYTGFLHRYNGYKAERTAAPALDEQKESELAKEVVRLRSALVRSDNDKKALLKDRRAGTVRLAEPTPRLRVQRTPQTVQRDSTDEELKPWVSYEENLNVRK
jgi:hypothetical protein